jgi:DNA repair protein RadC
MKNVNKPSTSIKLWAADDQPIEKMEKLGSTILSNAELIAIIIRTGNPNQSAVEVSKQVMSRCKNDFNELSKMTIKELEAVKGIGKTKAVSIIAALEIGRRKSEHHFSNKTVVKSSADVGQYLQEKLKDLSFEVFGVILLNQSNKIIRFEIISRGGITATIADPRIIMKLAINYNATSIIICHNHPSGNLMPSNADKEITNKIKESAKLLDIKLLDHIIVSDEGYMSFADENLL